MENRIIPHEERFKLIPSVYIMLIQDGKVLLSRRANTGFEDGNYGFVSGHVDGGETMTEALMREAREEAGLELNRDDLKLALTIHRNCKSHERVDLFFTAKSWGGKINNQEPGKCDDLSWFSLDALPANTINYIKKAIDCYKNNIQYCEFGWD